MAKYYRYVDLSNIRNPYLVPRAPGQSRTIHSPKDSELFSISLFIYRCLSVGTWSLPLGEAKLILRRKGQTVHDVNALIMRMISPWGLVFTHGSRLIAKERGLRLFAYRTLTAMIDKGLVRSAYITEESFRPKEARRNLVHVLNDLYFNPNEATLAFIRYCPPEFLPKSFKNELYHMESEISKLFSKSA